MSFGIGGDNTPDTFVAPAPDDLRTDPSLAGTVDLLQTSLFNTQMYLAGGVLTVPVGSDYSGAQGRYIGTVSESPQVGGFSGIALAGDYASDFSNECIWICTMGGTPGTWVQISGGGGGGGSTFTTTVTLEAGGTNAPPDADLAFTGTPVFNTTTGQFEGGHIAMPISLHVGLGSEGSPWIQDTVHTYIGEGSANNAYIGTASSVTVGGGTITMAATLAANILHLTNEYGTPPHPGGTLRVGLKSTLSDPTSSAIINYTSTAAGSGDSGTFSGLSSSYSGTNKLNGDGWQTGFTEALDPIAGGVTILSSYFKTVTSDSGEGALTSITAPADPIGTRAHIQAEGVILMDGPDMSATLGSPFVFQNEMQYQSTAGENVVPGWGFVNVPFSLVRGRSMFPHPENYPFTGTWDGNNSNSPGGAGGAGWWRGHIDTPTFNTGDFGGSDSWGGNPGNYLSNVPGVIQAGYPSTYPDDGSIIYQTQAQAGTGALQGIGYASQWRQDAGVTTYQKQAFSTGGLLAGGASNTYVTESGTAIPTSAPGQPLSVNSTKGFLAGGGPATVTDGTNNPPAYSYGFTYTGTSGSGVTSTLLGCVMDGSTPYNPSAEDVVSAGHSGGFLVNNFGLVVGAGSTQSGDVLTLGPMSGANAVGWSQSGDGKLVPVGPNNVAIWAHGVSWWHDSLIMHPSVNPLDQEHTILGIVNAHTYTEPLNPPIDMFPDSYIYDFPGSPLPAFIQIGGTHELVNNPGGSPVPILGGEAISYTPVISDGNSGVTNFGLGTVINLSPTYEATFNGTVLNIGTQYGIFISPTVQQAALGTSAVVRHGKLFNYVSRGELGLGVQLDEVQHFTVQDIAGPGAGITSPGNVGSQIGLAIPFLTTGDLNIGIQNAATTVFTPSFFSFVGASPPLIPGFGPAATVGSGSPAIPPGLIGHIGAITGPPRLVPRALIGSVASGSPPGITTSPSTVVMPMGGAFWQGGNGFDQNPSGPGGTFQLGNGGPIVTYTYADTTGVYGCAVASSAVYNNTGSQTPGYYPTAFETAYSIGVDLPVGGAGISGPGWTSGLLLCNFGTLYFTGITGNILNGVTTDITPFTDGNGIAVNEMFPLNPIFSAGITLPLAGATSSSAFSPVGGQFILTHASTPYTIDYGGIQNVSGHAGFLTGVTSESGAVTPVLFDAITPITVTLPIAGPGGTSGFTPLVASGPGAPGGGTVTIDGYQVSYTDIQSSPAALLGCTAMLNGNSASFTPNAEDLIIGTDPFYVSSTANLLLTAASSVRLSTPQSGAVSSTFGIYPGTEAQVLIVFNEGPHTVTWTPPAPGASYAVNLSGGATSATLAPGEGLTLIFSADAISTVTDIPCWVQVGGGTGGSGGGGGGIPGLQYLTGGGAINTATITSAISAGYVGIYLDPLHVWTVASTVVIKDISNFTIESRMQGSIGWVGDGIPPSTGYISVTTASNGIAVYSDGNPGTVPAQGVVLRNLAIVGATTSAASGNAILYLAGGQRKCTVEDCYIENKATAGNSVALQYDAILGGASYSSSNSENNYFDNCCLVGAWAALLIGDNSFGSGSNDSLWNNLTTSSSGPYSIVANQGAGHTFINYYDRSNPSTATVLNQGANGLLFIGGEDRNTNGQAHMVTGGTTVLRDRIVTVTSTPTSIAVSGGGTMVIGGTAFLVGNQTFTITGSNSVLDLSSPTFQFGVSGATATVSGSSGTVYVDTSGRGSGSKPTLSSFSGTLIGPVGAEAGNTGQTSSKSITWNPPMNKCRVRISVAISVTSTASGTVTPSLSYKDFDGTSRSHALPMWQSNSNASAPVYSLGGGTGMYNCTLDIGTDASGTAVTVSLTVAGSAPTFSYSYAIEPLYIG